MTRDEYIAIAADAAENVLMKGWTMKDAMSAALDAVSSWETRERAEKLLDELFEDRSARAHDCTVDCRVCSASASLGAVLDKVGK